MMLQGGAPPDTSAYYRAAYIWAAVLYSAYAAILWARGRRVRRRLQAGRARTASRGG